MALALRLLSAAWLLVAMPETARCQARQVDRSACLESAREAGHWLESVAIRTPDGAARWSAAPGATDDGTDELYSGTAGVVLFLLELERAGHDPAYRKLAIAGGKTLLRAVKELKPDSDPGLFTGVSGIGFTLRVLADRTGEESFRAASRKVLDHLKQSAMRGEHDGYPTARWSTVNDVIGGSTGIGMVWLDEYAANGDEEILKLAIAAGDGLLAAAEPANVAQEDAATHGGLKWPMEPGFPREMPNYSHGTAGVCDFLVQLHLACQNKPDVVGAEPERFIHAARRGADYLVRLSHDSSSGLLPHHFPDGDQLFYLGWCHGPAGTTALFERLAAAGHPEYEAAAQRLVSGLRSCGLPARSEGYWNNVSLCCGNAGLIAFLSRREDADSMALAQALFDDLLSRATRIELPNGRHGLFWTQAEHRVRPELLQAQTGLMQGAAGIGLALLKMHEGKAASGQLQIPGLNF